MNERSRDATSKSTMRPTLRGKDARRFTVRMPRNTRQGEVPSARRLQSGRTARQQEWKL